MLTALRSIKEFGGFLHGDIEVPVIVIYLSLSLVYLLRINYNRPIATLSKDVYAKSWRETLIRDLGQQVIIVSPCTVL